MWSLFGHCGKITLVWWDDSRTERVEKGGLFITPANAAAASSYFMQADVRGCLGFYEKFERDEKFVAIPFWFLTTISAALLWLVWRKTRLPVKGRAFPVEVGKPIGEQGSKTQ
jgi:hypothetical protein